jgi:hypothetical protein
MSQEGMNWGGITGHRSGIKGQSGFVQVSSEWLAHERSATEEEYLEYSKRSFFYYFFFFFFPFFSLTIPSFPQSLFGFFVVLRCVCVLHQVFPKSCV